MRKVYYSKSLRVDITDRPGSIEQALYSIKRDLILFDQIVYPNLNNRLSFVYDNYRQNFGSELSNQLAEFTFLQNCGLIKDYRLLKRADDSVKLMNNLPEMEAWRYETFMLFTKKYNDDVIVNYKQYLEEQNPKRKAEILRHCVMLENWKESVMSLALTEHLQHIDELDVVNSQQIHKGYIVGRKPSIAVNKPTVYNFTLENLPFPSDVTPWQDILEYKSDNENQRRIISLRKWLGKVVKEEYSVNELVDEYESFYLDFESAIKRHRIKTKKTWLKIMVVGGAEIFEDIVKIRLKSIAEKIFKHCIEATMEQVELTEAEAAAPGRELAYMLYSKEKFT